MLSLNARPMQWSNYCSNEAAPTIANVCCDKLLFCSQGDSDARASAHRVKWSQLIPPWKMDEKLKRERRYVDHMFIQKYFRMHHFVVKFSKFLRLRQQRGIDPLTKILRTHMQ